jgi:type 1 glutamine amidotransferase
MSSTLEFAHDTIGTCNKMLMDLGKADAPERAKIAGLGADTTWTVDLMITKTNDANYFSEVTAANLKNYEMFYSNNPTGPVFTQAPMGAQKKTIFQEWWSAGGAWAGQHSASDFEKTNGGSWPWFNDNIDGAYFVDHDGPGTNGTITWGADFVNHPIVKGLPSPYSSGEEWYLMNRNVEAVAGFKVLGKVQVTNSSKGTTPRPAVWINEKGGRAFYTIKGHSMSTYAEAPFRDLMLRGILWAVHRLPGGN